MSLLLTTALTAQVTVLGYFPSYRDATTVQYSKLTDIAFSFINPNTDGSLNQVNTDATFGFDMTKFTVVKSNCASKNVKLWIALGGADDNNLRRDRLNSVCANSTYRAKLVSDLVSFAITHGLEGIDIDWEFPINTTMQTGHKNLITDLRAAINASSKPTLKISVAVGGEYKNAVNHLQYIDPTVISNSALVDKWNIMAYDFPVSYGVSHSSYADAQGSIEAWNQQKGIPYSKMLLGVPFYGKTSDASRTATDYKSLGGTASVNYTADSYGSIYYNGKTTLESKMDLIMGKGGLGILIWDLGQDRATGNYSLLDAIYTKAGTLCLVPKPNLGPDKGVCTGQSTTLDPGVATTSGRTFAWFKNNVSTGQTTPTISVNSAGTYKVSITQSGCTLTDEIVIVTGSSVTTTDASGCNDKSLTLSVNNPDGSKTYKWYDAASGGALLGTGTSYSAIFPTTKTVYVEEAAAGVVSYSSSIATIPTGKYHSWGGDTYTKGTAQRLVVETDLTVKSLRMIVSAKVGATFTIKVANSSNLTVLKTIGPWTAAGDGISADSKEAYYDVTTNLTLTPGSYFIYPEVTAGKWGFINGPTFQEDKQAGVFTLKGSMYQASATVPFTEGDEGKSWWSAYGPFLDWKIETGANASCGRTAATATVQQCGPPSISISSPTATTYYRGTPISFSSSITDEGTVSSVVYEVYKGAVLVQTLTVSQTGSTYTSSWTPTVTGTDYSFKVTATDNEGNPSTKTVNFTVDFPIGVGTLSANSVQLYPNPSESAFQLNVDGASSYDVYVYSVSGQLLESQNVSGTATSFGSTLNSGLYLVKVVSANGTYQTQVVKK